MRGGVLALDISSVRTGVAYGGEESSSPHCLSWIMPGGADLARCCSELSQSILSFAGIVHPKIIAVEAALNRVDPTHGARVAKVLMYLCGSAFGAGHAAQARVIEGNIQTVRSHFIGNGNLPGEEAKRRVQAQCDKLQWEYKNHDEADAAALWSWTMTNNFKRWTPPMLFGRPVVAVA